MKHLNTDILLIKPIRGNPYQRITNQQAGWKFLNFNARCLRNGETITGDTTTNEFIFVLLAGDFSAYTSKGNWKTKNGRRDVFSGLPHALYLPPRTTYTIKAESEKMDIACGWCTCDEIHEVQFITPVDIYNKGIEYRGGDNASRQINSILPPGSDCQRLICVEVYTPSGNWSSYPPHKHDTRKLDPYTGKILEADLEEVYFYKTDKPQGFAIQKIYTDDRRINEIVEARNNDLVLVPCGYHPVIAGHGYNVYYLNVLAGTDQSLAGSDDPNHRWIHGTWKGMDPRIPMVTLEMNNQKNEKGI
ncbi:MAG: 5-deoxy-glucuronate isomerase [Bacteroidales bacterium]|nr:5-deoxy-glucuronate isomerase [Bacteroidales bacterium]